MTDTPIDAASPTTRNRHNLTERYVHAATRRLPEEQRDDVAAELRTGIADRIDSLLEERPGFDEAEAERLTLVELGDPDRLAAGYTGSRLHLVGPDVYPAYVRVLKAVLLTAVPVAATVIAVIDTLDGASLGAVIGRTAWMAFTVAVQIAFWITLTFAVAERCSTGTDVRSSVGADWTPDQLPAMPMGSRAALGEAVTNIAWLGILAAAIVWQQLRSPLSEDGDRIPILDPDLWSFWLPLVLVLIAAEAVFELVKYRAGGVWTRGFALVNTGLGLLFAAPTIYLAGNDLLLNPAMVEHVQDSWSGFDPGTVNTVVIVGSLLVWAWDTAEGWRRAR